MRGQPAEAANVRAIIALRAGFSACSGVHGASQLRSGCEAFTQAYEKMLAGRGEFSS